MKDRVLMQLKTIMTATPDLVIRSISPEMQDILLCLQNHLPLPVGSIIGKSIDIFHPNPKLARRILSDLRNLPHETIIRIGAEVLNARVDAVYDENMQYQGPSVSWEIITDKFNQKQRVVLVDQADLVRAQLEEILQGSQDIEVVGEAANIQEAREIILTVKPDIVILDVKTPDQQGFEILRELKKQLPDIRFMILSNYPYFIYQKENSDFGFCSFINKTTDFKKIPEIIRKLKSYNKDF